MKNIESDGRGCLSSPLTSTGTQIGAGQTVIIGSWIGGEKPFYSWKYEDWVWFACGLRADTKTGG